MGEITGLPRAVEAMSASSKILRLVVRPQQAASMDAA
jgi:hypothetical protein